MSAYIELRDICYRYKKTGFAVENVSLELKLGQAAMLTGGNGSGKTTLSKLIMGMLKPDSGSVIVHGEDMKKTRLANTAKKIGYLFQNPDRQLFCTTALDEIKFSITHSGSPEGEAEERARELLSRFSMSERAEDFPLKLSKGEKQRLALLAVFAMRPAFYILDEPSTGIDGENKEKLFCILEEIKREGAGLLIITHDKQLKKRIADRVITMSKGRAISDEEA